MSSSCSSTLPRLSLNTVCRWLLTTRAQLENTKCNKCRRTFPRDETLVNQGNFVRAHDLFFKGTDVVDDAAAKSTLNDEKSSLGLLQESAAPVDDTMNAPTLSTPTSCEICFVAQPTHSLFRKTTCRCNVTICLECSVRISKCPLCRSVMHATGETITVAVSKEHLSSITSQFVDQSTQIIEDTRRGGADPDENPPSSRDEDTENDAVSTETAYESDTSEDEDDDEDGGGATSSVTLTLDNSMQRRVNIPFMLPDLETRAERITRFSQSPEVTATRLRHDLVCDFSSQQASAWLRSAYASSAVMYSWDDAVYDSEGTLRLTIPTTLLCDIFRNLVRGLRALIFSQKLKRHLGLVKLTHYVCATLREDRCHNSPHAPDRHNWLEENDIVAVAIGTLRRRRTFSTAAERVAVRWETAFPEEQVPVAARS